MKAREVKGREEGEVKLYSSRRKEEKGGNRKDRKECEGGTFEKTFECEEEEEEEVRAK